MLELYVRMATGTSTMNLSKLLHNAFQVRAELVKELEREDTDTWRMFHGVNEGRAGLTIDRYGPQLLLSESSRRPMAVAAVLVIGSMSTVCSFWIGLSTVHPLRPMPQRRMRQPRPCGWMLSSLL